MSICVEKAHEQELSEIVLILDKCRKLLQASGSPQWSNDDAPSKEAMVEALAHESVYLLKVNGKIIGTAILTNEPELAYETLQYGSWEHSHGGYASIHRFAIDPSENGKGYAKLFFQLLTVIARENGASHIRVDTYPLNRAMQNVILSSGYRFKGIVNLPIEHGERYAYERVLR